MKLQPGMAWHGTDLSVCNCGPPLEYCDTVGRICSLLRVLRHWQPCSNAMALAAFCLSSCVAVFSAFSSFRIPFLGHRETHADVTPASYKRVGMH